MVSIQKIKFNSQNNFFHSRTTYSILTLSKKNPSYMNLPKMTRIKQPQMEQKMKKSTKKRIFGFFNTPKKLFFCHRSTFKHAALICWHIKCATSAISEESDREHNKKANHQVHCIGTTQNESSPASGAAVENNNRSAIERRVETNAQINQNYLVCPYYLG